MGDWVSVSGSLLAVAVVIASAVGNVLSQRRSERTTDLSVLQARLQSLEKDLAAAERQIAELRGRVSQVEAAEAEARRRVQELTAERLMLLERLVGQRV